jgi:hypothetical protein
MFSPFFTLAAVSPGRQLAFRYLVIAHLAILTGLVWALPQNQPTASAVLLATALVVAGIVEGAILVGWRLTQLPKSQALEFLLVSPLRPRNVFLAETLVGLTRLALVTLAGLPVLVYLRVEGILNPTDLWFLLLVPWTWGGVTGLGLTVWAFEPASVRRWGERVTLGLIVVYLIIGVLAGEHLRSWVDWLGGDLKSLFLSGFEGMHCYNPFAVLKYWMENEPAVAWDRMLGVEIGGLVALGLLLLRGSSRLHPHFQERHYRPIVDPSNHRRGRIGDRPLAWWAVRRVAEYSGRVNLWLAGGFAVLYALYTIAGPWWPTWLGRQTFLIFDRAGGIPALAAALVILSAVPAAFQYGLWDSNSQERCRRLELLLLTRLTAYDYWEAAAAAAWQRGRGYFGVALLLWSAAVLAGQVSVLQVVAAMTAGVVLWGLYFALGFRAFSRGHQANGLGLLLTVGLPLLACALYQTDWAALGELLPPGSVYSPGARPPTLTWLLGPTLGAALALAITHLALQRCDRELRFWYDQNHGRKLLE